MIRNIAKSIYLILWFPPGELQWMPPNAVTSRPLCRLHGYIPECLLTMSTGILYCINSVWQCSATCGKGIQYRRRRSTRSTKHQSCTTHLGPLRTRECVVSSCNHHDSSNSVPSAFVTVAEYYTSVQSNIFRTIITMRSKLKNKNSRIWQNYSTVI